MDISAFPHRLLTNVFMPFHQAAQNASLCVAFNAAMTVFPPGCQISVGCFPWAPVDPSSPMYQHFDALLCADCLFFEEFHEQLLSVCATCLKVDADAKVAAYCPLQLQ